MFFSSVCSGSFHVLYLTPFFRRLASQLYWHDSCCLARKSGKQSPCRHSSSRTWNTNRNPSWPPGCRCYFCPNKVSFGCSQNSRQQLHQFLHQGAAAASPPKHLRFTLPSRLITPPLLKRVRSFLTEIQADLKVSCENMLASFSSVACFTVSPHHLWIRIDCLKTGSYVHIFQSDYM